MGFWEVWLAGFTRKSETSQEGKGPFLGFKLLCCLFSVMQESNRKVGGWSLFNHLLVMDTRSNANIQITTPVPNPTIIFSITLLAIPEIFVESEFVCIFYIPAI